jgi:hypothetical protein
LDLLRLQIRVGPVDIVDAEVDAADADVVEGQLGLALRRRVGVSRRFSPPETVFLSAIFYVLCTNSSEGALKKESRES